MGGRSSSKQESKQSTVNKTVNASVEDVENSNIVTNSGDNVELTLTDHGAINAAGEVVYEAFEIARESFDFAEANSEQVFEAIEGVNQRTIDTVEKVSLAAQTQGQTIIADTLTDIFKPFLYVLLAVLAVVVLVMIYKGTRK
jgi:hypothetical protein